MHRPTRLREPGDLVRPPTRTVNPSYRELRRGQPAERASHDGRNLWLRLTAPAPIPVSASPVQHERQRKAELTAYAALGAMAVGLALLPLSLSSHAALVSAGLLMAGALAVAALNRANATQAAALTLVGAISAAVLGGAWLSPHQTSTLDYLALPALLAGLLVSRRAPFVVVAADALASAALVILQRGGTDLGRPNVYQDIAHALAQPVALMLVVALASWLWARSVERALRRADRAEAVAAMEHALAEQSDQLERGIQALLATLVQVANGDFSARTNSSQENLLWQVAVPLNKLLARLATVASASHRLQATERDIDRLTDTLAQAHAGFETTWPSPGGTRVDHLLSVLVAESLYPRAAAAEPLDRSQAAAESGSNAHAAPPETPVAEGSRATARPAATALTLPTHRHPNELAPWSFAGSVPSHRGGLVPIAEESRRGAFNWATHPLPTLPPLAPSFQPGQESAAWSPPDAAPPARATAGEIPSTPNGVPHVGRGADNAAETGRRDEHERTHLASPPAGDFAEDLMLELPATPDPTRKTDAGSTKRPATIVHVVPSEGEWPDWPEFLRSLAATPTASQQVDNEYGSPPDGH